jgi:hypothetical protein
VTQNQKVYNKSYEKIKVIEEELPPFSTTEYEDIITGEDIIAKYSEVKNTDYAILVATTPFLEADMDLIADEPEYSYIKYVINESGQNVAETILDSNGVEVILSLVNYNAVLQDGCIFHKKSSYLYETAYGFLEEDIVAEGLNESEIDEKVTFKAVLPLNNKKNSINYIKKDSVFSETYLVDIDSKVIGSIYIEQKGSAISEE